MAISEHGAFDAEFLVLPGVILPADAARLIDELYSRGFSLHRDGDHLVVSEHHRLTDDDRARLMRWKWHVLSYIDRYGWHDAHRGTRQ